jgi:hypothetical protein
VGFPGDVVGAGADGKVRRAECSKHGGGGTGELGQPFGHARPTRPVTVFIPPAVFEEEEAVLDLPMRADSRQQLRRGDLLWIETGEKVARVGRQHGAIVGNYVPINTQRNSRPGKRQGLANVIGVVQIEPELAVIGGGPFFSTVSAAGGRSWALPKQTCNTSRMSP